MTYVTQEWLVHLTLKQQTVVLSAIRGCDGVPKDDLSKPFVRALRSIVLKNAVDGPCLFMESEISNSDIEKFVKALDHYPMHWLMHFIHAVECIGYGHTEPVTRIWWKQLYRRLCDALHVNAETLEEWDYRLIDGPSSDCWKA